MKRIIVGTLMVVLAGPVLAASPLPPGSSLNNPDVGSGTYFDTALPAYFVPANMAAPTLVSAYVGGFSGTVTSNVYRNPVTKTLAFEYLFTNTTVLPGGAPPGGPVLDLTKATIGDPSVKPWLGFTISNAGSDGTGSSTAVGSPSWSDGDPYALDRDSTAAGEGLTIYWKVFNNGTVIRNSVDYSARVFFETDAKYFMKTSVGILDSGVVSHAEAYAPTLIPEPASLGLLGLGGLGLLLRRRRR